MPVWTFDAFGQSLAIETDLILRLVMAMVLGGLIGLDRELRDKPAGMRTIMLICVGSALFSIVSELLGGPEGESTRIAAQIVTGVGFLGAGSIIRHQVSIVGLTTAATIWAVAAIGMAVGFGQYVLGIAGTVVMILVLFFLNFIEQTIGDRLDLQEYHIAVESAEDALSRVKELFRAAHLGIKKCCWYEDGPVIVFEVLAMGRKTRHEQLRWQIARSAEYALRR